MNAFWPGGIGRWKPALAICWPRRATSLTSTSTGTWRKGRKLTGPYLSRVEVKRTALYQRICGFMEKYEFFVLPVNQVLPFDVNTHYPTEIAGVKMENYLAWMKSAYYISVAGNPAISVPCAFSAGGLPIGMQIVGAPPRRVGPAAACLRVRTSHQHRQTSPGSCLTARVIHFCHPPPRAR